MKENFRNNSDLILYLKKGKANAYAYLVDTYNHKLCLYANSLMNNTPISEDIVQNVFIKVWERRDNLKTDFSIKSYLYKSVYNACINEYKRNQSVTALEKTHMQELDRIIEDKDEGALGKLIDLVTEAILELPPKCKEIFLLSKKEGLTNIEISEYLNLSKNTIERQINIAFSKIRENVGNKTDIILFYLQFLNISNSFSS
ncbi:MAG: RNA polymerase sigma factor [Polaribacter sp.]